MNAQYPRGKLRADDRGAIPMRFVVQDGTLMIVFPYPVDWLGFGLTEVEDLIAMLLQKRDELIEGRS